MKNTIKKTTKKAISMLLSVVILFTIMSVGFVLPASAATFSSGSYLYLNTNIWNTDNPRFAAYFFVQNSSTNKWVTMYKSPADSSCYWVKVPSGASWTHVIFCRMNPSHSTNAFNSTYMWNKTNDLAPSDTTNCFKVNSWSSGNWDGTLNKNNSNGSWSTLNTTVSFKFVNSDDWKTPKAYIYSSNSGDTLSSWPGSTMSTTNTYAPNNGEIFTFSYNSYVFDKLIFSGYDVENYGEYYSETLEQYPSSGGIDIKNYSSSSGGQYFNSIENKWYTNSSSMTSSGYDLMINSKNGYKTYNKFTNNNGVYECTVTLDHHAYVYARTSNEGIYFRPSSFVSSGDSATLKRSSSGAYSTLFVPAGKIKYTLKENTGGTLTLSYELLEKCVDTHSGYYLSGSFNEWGKSNRMSYVAGSTVETSLYLNEGHYEFKLNDIDGTSTVGYGDWYSYSDNSYVINDSVSNLTLGLISQKVIILT